MHLAYIASQPPLQIAFSQACPPSKHHSTRSGGVVSIPLVITEFYMSAQPLKVHRDLICAAPGVLSVLCGINDDTHRLSAAAFAALQGPMSCS